MLPTSSASNGKESQGGESSGNSGNVASGDSSHLPPSGTAASAVAPPSGSLERPESAGEERGARVLGTVFEAQNTELESHTASPVVPAIGDSAGLTKPLDQITASMLEGEVSPVDSLNEQGSGGSDDALLGGQAGLRSDSGTGAGAAAAEAAAGPSPKRRHVFSSLLPSISPFRSFSGPDAAAQEPADVGTSSTGPAANQDAT